MTAKNTKPLAKSLHTVTVLVRMACAYRETVDWGSTPWPELVDQVLADLGMDERPDTYDLRGLALAQLEA